MLGNPHDVCVCEVPRSVKHRQPANTDVMWVAEHRWLCLGLSTCFQNCFVPFFPLPKKFGPNCSLGLDWRSYPSFSFQSENCAMACYASRHRWLGMQKFQFWGMKCQPTIGKSWFCVYSTFKDLWRPLSDYVLVSANENGRIRKIKKTRVAMEGVMTKAQFFGKRLGRASLWTPVKMISIETLFRGESRGGSLVIRQFRVIRGVNMVADFKNLLRLAYRDGMQVFQG